jgi:hypothetical protein
LTVSPDDDVDNVIDDDLRSLITEVSSDPGVPDCWRRADLPIPADPLRARRSTLRIFRPSSTTGDSRR